MSKVGDIETHGKFVYITGKVMYAKVFEHNRDLEGFEGQYKPHDGMYTIMLGVPEGGEAFKTIMSWNKMYEPKEGGHKNLPVDKGADPALMYFTFKRKHTFKSSKTGEVIAAFGGSPRVVLLTDPKKEIYETFPDGELIGNGSVVTAKLEVYKLDPKRSIVRLEAVSVDDWVKLEKNPQSDGSSEVDDDIPF